MRKILLLLAVAFFALSCEGPGGPPGPRGPQGPGTEWAVKYLTVESSGWRLSGNPDAYGSYYYCTFNVSDLSNYIYDEGTVLAYLAFSNDVQSPLPYSEYHGETDDYYWNQKVDYEYTPGTITFYVTRSDFFTAANRPPAYQFKVVFLW